MSKASTVTCRRNRYTQEWLEASSFNAATVDGQLVHGEDEHEESLPTHLYSLCRNALRDLCTQDQNSLASRPRLILLREELTKLYLWGQSFGPGELDIALEYSDDARHIVLDALGDIGRSLLREISRISDPVLKPANVDQQAQELKHLVEQTRAIASNEGENDEEAGSDGSVDIDDESASDDEGTGDIIKELGAQIRYLVELEPTLQQNLLYARKARVKSSYPPVLPFHLSDPARIYVSLVRERYRQAQDQLVERLGEANWQRHKSVRGQAENMKSHQEDADGVLEGESLSLKDMDVPYSAFRPYSAFHDSGIGTSVPAYTEYAPSHTSFQSSNRESEQGSIRVPPTPEEVGAGEPFQCPFCGSTLTNIKSRVEWKMHVFADLRPYICTFASCEKELAQFPTRAAWADHEFTEHRVLRSWICPECSKQCDSEMEWTQHLEIRHQRTFLGLRHKIAREMAYTARAKPTEDEACPLCRIVLGKPRREFVKHVGRHMEEIALMALPRDNDEESEACSTGTESDPSSSPTPAAHVPGDTGIDIVTLGDLPLPRPITPAEQKPMLEYLHCTSVVIGQWRRVCQQPEELVVFYALEKACFTYVFRHSGVGFRIEYPFSYVKAISVENPEQPHDHSAGHHGLLIELNRPPNFFMDSAGTGSIFQCEDFTEDQQASVIMYHHLRGDLAVLQGQLAKLTSSASFQTRLHALRSLPDLEQCDSPRQHTAAQGNMIQHQSGSALSDYNQQIMLLEQQNKKRLLMARKDTAQGYDPLSLEASNYKEKPNLTPESDRDKETGKMPLMPTAAHDTSPSALPIPGKKILIEPPKATISALRINLSHTTNMLNNEQDEYTPRLCDEQGERKVSPTGELLGNRQFRVQTFYVKQRGEKHFMLATECARVLGYRDSYLLFNKHPSLYKIVVTPAEKDELLHQEILPYSFRSCQVAIVTAKSIFRQFGARIIEGGRRVRDDYWEAKAIEQGFTQDDMAGVKRPGAAKARDVGLAAEASQTLLETSTVYGPP